MMSKYWFLSLLFPIFLQGTHGTITLPSQSFLDKFVQAQQHDCLLQYYCMVDLFVSQSLPYKKLIKKIKDDIKTTSRLLKKDYKGDEEYIKLHQNLIDLCHYVHVHQDCYKAIQFYKYLEKEYFYAFDNPDLVLSINYEPELYGLEKSRYRYKDYYKKINKDLKKLDIFERLIHSDLDELKAHNFVYKIELLKMKSQIYHHNRYKFETRIF